MKNHPIPSAFRSKLFFSSLLFDVHRQAYRTVGITINLPRKVTISFSFHHHQSKHIIFLLVFRFVMLDISQPINRGNKNGGTTAALAPLSHWHTISVRSNALFASVRNSPRSIMCTSGWNPCIHWCARHIRPNRSYLTILLQAIDTFFDALDIKFIGNCLDKCSSSAKTFLWHSDHFINRRNIMTEWTC